MRALAALLILAAGEARLAAEEIDTMSVSIEQVKTKYEERLLQIPNAVSVGIGLDMDGTPVIVVGLSQPIAEAELALPAAVDGYRVEYRVTGTPSSQ